MTMRITKQGEITVRYKGTLYRLPVCSTQQRCEQVMAAYPDRVVDIPTMLKDNPGETPYKGQMWLLKLARMAAGELVIPRQLPGFIQALKDGNAVVQSERRFGQSVNPSFNPER